MQHAGPPGGQDDWPPRRQHGRRGRPRAGSDLTGPADNLAHMPGGSRFAAYVITAYSQAERVNSRNGYRRREWDTRAGTVELAIPKRRQGSYYPARW